jgi:hypothetical protein
VIALKEKIKELEETRVWILQKYKEANTRLIKKEIWSSKFNSRRIREINNSKWESDDRRSTENQGNDERIRKKINIALAYWNLI